MINIKRYNLRQLKRKFINRDFAIPEIQRQYVWKKPRIANLMDSIFRNYPIGISLIWSAPFSKAIQIRPNHKTIIPPFNKKKAKQIDLIIDGQQRLSTLFGIMMGIEERPEANSDINFKELFFDCDKKAEKRFVFSKKLDGYKGYIKVYDLITTPHSLLKKQLRLTKWEASEAIKCYRIFHAYSFFLLEFKGNDFNDIREIFIRINSAGMNVNRADTLFAKASDVKLRDHMLDTKRGLKHGYDNISTDALQNTLALASGSNQIGGRAFNSILTSIEKNKHKNSEFSKLWKKLQYGFEEAVDFLVNHIYVKNPSLLPSQNIYTLLSYFFFLNQSRANPRQIKEIKKWFWYTACGERYSGSAFNRNIPEDIKFFKRLANSNTARFNIRERINSIDFFKTEYRKSSSKSNAYFILLRNKKPMYLINGQEMMLDEASSISNRKDRHHIFPNAMLRRQQISLKWINSICNICYLESDENQSISDTHPRKYLHKYKKRKHFGKVMRSHMIPVDQDSPVWNTNLKQSYLKFLNIRGNLILKEIERLAGVKIFEKFDEIKRL